MAIIQPSALVPLLRSPTLPPGYRLPVPAISFHGNEKVNP